MIYLSIKAPTNLIATTVYECLQRYLISLQNWSSSLDDKVVKLARLALLRVESYFSNDLGTPIRCNQVV